MSKKIELEVRPIEEAENVTMGDATGKHFRIVYRVIEEGTLSEWRCAVEVVRNNGYNNFGEYLRRTRSSWMISSFAFISLEV